MNKQEYEQKKRECWDDFWRETNGAINYNHEAVKVLSDALFTAFDRAYALGKQEKDAEGEEMLTVSRKEVQELFANAKKHHDLYTSATCINESESRTIDVCLGRIQVLDTLFGSKCLPDESESPKLSKVEKVGKDCNVDSLPTNVDSSDDCKAEPKFKIGDKVRYVGDMQPTYKGKAFVIDGEVFFNNHYNEWQTRSIKPFAWDGLSVCNVPLTGLEPYTEPEKESRNLSKNIANCDKHFDNILKDSFSKERRLNIATRIMAAILSNQRMLNNLAHGETTTKGVVRCIVDATMMYTDALIAECEKGGSDGN